MKFSFIKTPLFLGLILLFIGFSSLVIENTFFQYLDDNKILHESLFLPFGAFTIILGVLVLFYLLVKKSIQLLRIKK